MNKDEAWLLNEKYNGMESAAFAEDCKRLAAGEPLAYLIGWVPFLDTKIALDSRPLIPRPETEYWVSEILTEIPEAAHILDLCAGSGCIGVAVAKARMMARVDFSEIDARHHDTIAKNLAHNGITYERTRIFGGDLFEQVTDRYDYILSNPPYIDPALDRTEESVRAFEPHHALYGGTEGMELVSRIIADAPRFLNPHGVLVIEHEPEQVESIRREADKAGFATETHTDQFGVLRFTRLVLY